MYFPKSANKYLVELKKKEKEEIELKYSLIITFSSQDCTSVANRDGLKARRNERLILE